MFDYFSCKSDVCKSLHNIPDFNGERNFLMEKEEKNFAESLIKLKRERKKGRLVEGKKRRGNVVRGEGRVLQPSLHFESIERKVERKKKKKEEKERHRRCSWMTDAGANAS